MSLRRLVMQLVRYGDLSSWTLIFVSVLCLVETGPPSWAFHCGVSSGTSRVEARMGVHTIVIVAAKRRVKIKTYILSCSVYFFGFPRRERLFWKRLLGNRLFGWSFFNTCSTHQVFVDVVYIHVIPCPVFSRYTPSVLFIEQKHAFVLVYFQVVCYPSRILYILRKNGICGLLLQKVEYYAGVSCSPEFSGVGLNVGFLHLSWHNQFCGVIYLHFILLWELIVDRRTNKIFY